MGGDGGSIPKRADMVRTKGYSSAQSSSTGSMGYNPNLQRKIAQEHVDPKRQRQLCMSKCWLTGQPLEDPIAVCRGGYLYNKESVVSFLLEKNFAKLPPHVTSIRDIIDVKFKRSRGGSIVCPITGKELDDGVHKSVVCWPCGCALSVKALELHSNNSENKNCINCGAAVDDTIKLYPEDKADQEKQLEKAFEQRYKKVVAGDKGHHLSTCLKRKPGVAGIEEVEKLKQSRVYEKIFHSSSRS